MAMTYEQGNAPIPLEDARECAKGDPILQSMIDKGLPLTRNRYLARAGIDDEELSAEAEVSLPECFQDQTRKLP